MPFRFNICLLVPRPTIRSLTAEITRRWRCMRRVDGVDTPACTALVNDTVKYIRHPESLAQHIATARGTSAMIDPEYAVPNVGPQVLGKRRFSELVWSTVAHHQVPWEQCLELAKLQTTYVPTSKVDALNSVLAEEPDKVVQRVLQVCSSIKAEVAKVTECQQRKHEFSPQTRDTCIALEVDRSLMQCTSIVQYAAEVMRRLHEYGEVDRVLPITKEALLHCYYLAKGDEDAVAMQVLKHIRLAPGEPWTATEREAWTAMHASLYSIKGDWRAALQVIRHDRAVRHSAKVLFSRYVSSLTLWERVLMSTTTPESSLVTRAVASAASWECATRAFAASPTPTAASSLLSRRDYLAVSSWESALWMYQLAEPKSYIVAIHICAKIPLNHPECSVLCARVMSSVADSVHPVSVTRSAFAAVQRHQWATAVGILCGAGCYDIASHVVSHLSKVGSAEAQMVLPAELLEFEHVSAILRVQDPSSTLLEHVRKWSSSACLAALLYVAQVHHDSVDHARVGTALKSTGVASALQPPLASELLARVGGQQAVGEGMNSKRNKSLLLALRVAIDGASATLPVAWKWERDDVHCYTFQSAFLSKLVASYAASPDRSYFFRKLPPALQDHHWVLPSKDLSDLRDSITAYERLWNSDFIASTSEDYALVMQRITNMLRESRVQSGDSNFLREVARWVAAGRFHGPSALLQLAAARYGVVAGLSYAALARIGSTLPVQFIASQPLAVDHCVSGFAVLGMWQHALRFFPWSSAPEADEYVKGLYAAPRADAIKVLKKRMVTTSTWVNAINSVVLDLWNDDIRSYLDALHSVPSPGAAGQPTRPFSSRTKKREPTKTSRQRLVRAERRRKETLLGAALCNLDSTSLILRAARAAHANAKVSAVDCDGIGIQRLISGLPWEMALQAVADLSAYRRVVEEQWLISIVIKPGCAATITDPSDPTTVTAVERTFRVMCEVLPYSRCVRALCHVSHACASEDGLLSALHTLTLFAQWMPRHGPVASAIGGPYITALAFYIRQVLLRFDISKWDERSTKAMGRLFHEVTTLSQYSATLKFARKVVPRLVKYPQEDSGFFLMGFLYSSMARKLKIPVVASLTSRMLQSLVVVKVSNIPSPNQVDVKTQFKDDIDWHSAVYFFAKLKTPTDSERALLLVALRSTGFFSRYDAMLRCHRFFKGHPEQIVWWSYVMSLVEQSNEIADNSSHTTDFVPARTMPLATVSALVTLGTASDALRTASTSWLRGLELLARDGKKPFECCGTEWEPRKICAPEELHSVRGSEWIKKHVCPQWNWRSALVLVSHLRRLGSSGSEYFPSEWSASFLDEPSGAQWAAALTSVSEERSSGKQ